MAVIFWREVCQPSAAGGAEGERGVRLGMWRVGCYLSCEWDNIIMIWKWCWKRNVGQTGTYLVRMALWLPSPISTANVSITIPKEFIYFRSYSVPPCNNIVHLKSICLCVLKRINELDAIHALFTSVTANNAECDWRYISETEITEQCRRLSLNFSHQGELLASVCTEYTNSLLSIFRRRANSNSFHPAF